MSQNIHGDVVNALLAGRDSQRVNTSKKTSRSSRRKPKCSESTTKPAEAVALNRNGGLIRNHKQDSTDADNRLREFMLGLRSTRVNDEDEEHWYNPDGGRNYTLQEIADIMGVSRERVRQIEEISLRKLWRYIKIMNKREGVSEDEMFQIFTENNHGENTVYMP